MKKPLTPEEAEKLAFLAVQKYLNDCNITERSQICNYLMKICSVSGVVMAQAEGAQAASEKLAATAFFILQNTPRLPADIVPVH